MLNLDLIKFMYLVLYIYTIKILNNGDILVIVGVVHICSKDVERKVCRTRDNAAIAWRSVLKRQAILDSLRPRLGSRPSWPSNSKQEIASQEEEEHVCRNLKLTEKAFLIWIRTCLDTLPPKFLT